MSRNQSHEEIDVFYREGEDGPVRVAMPVQPKRPPAPTFASESTLLKAMKGKPVSEASLRISQYTYRTSNAASGDDEDRAAWKADYRKLMGKWRKGGGNGKSR